MALRSLSSHAVTRRTRYSSPCSVDLFTHTLPSKNAAFRCFLIDASLKTLTKSNHPKSFAVPMGEAFHSRLLLRKSNVTFAEQKTTMG